MSNAWELPQEDRSTRWLAHALLATLVFFIVVALAWASLAQLDEIARADGRIITSRQVQLVQNLEGGIVSEILAKEGDVVNKGQVLLRIDDTRFASEFRGGKQADFTLRARVARLRAESTGTKLVIPDDIARENRSLAMQETALFESRAKDLATKDQILRQQLTQRRSEIRELETRVQRLGDSLALIEKEIALTTPMVKQGIVSEVDLLRQQREAARIRTEIDSSKLAIPRAQAAALEAEQRIRDNQLAFRSQAAGELSVAVGELAKLKESIPALEDRVARTTVRSPVRGIVKTMAVKTVGGVVQPGSPMAEVVPLEDTLLVEARLRPSDIAFIRVGQPAVVKLTAYDYSIYGGLDGRIEHVGADSVQPQEGDPYYVAHVRTNTAALHHEGKELSIMPGMQGAVDIITGKKTVLQYLIKPVNRIQERALRER